MNPQLEEAVSGSRRLVALGKMPVIFKYTILAMSISIDPDLFLMSKCTDCGAGIGRVSNELLLQYFNEVDLLEPSVKLIDEARKNLSGRVTNGECPLNNPSHQADLPAASPSVSLPEPGRSTKQQKAGMSQQASENKRGGVAGIEAALGHDRKRPGWTTSEREGAQGSGIIPARHRAVHFFTQGLQDHPFSMPAR